MADTTKTAVATTTTPARLPDSNPYSCDVLRIVANSDILPNRCLTEPTSDSNEQARLAAQWLSEVRNGNLGNSAQPQATIEWVPLTISNCSNVLDNSCAADITTCSIL